MCYSATRLLGPVGVCGEPLVALLTSVLGKESVTLRQEIPLRVSVRQPPKFRDSTKLLMHSRRVARSVSRIRRSPIVIMYSSVFIR